MRPEYGTAGMNALTCGKTLSSTAPAITRKRSYIWRIIPFSGLAANKGSVFRQEKQLHVRSAVSSADWPAISQSGDKDCFTSYGYLRDGSNVVFCRQGSYSGSYPRAGLAQWSGVWLISRGTSARFCFCPPLFKICGLWTLLWLCLSKLLKH